MQMGFDKYIELMYEQPVSSTTISTKEMYRKTGFEVAKRTIARIKGPTATHMASGRCLPIIGDIAKTGTAIIGVSTEENLEELKAACKNKLSSRPRVGPSQNIECI